MHHSYYAGATFNVDDDVDDGNVVFPTGSPSPHSVQGLGVEIDINLLSQAMSSLSASQRLNLPSDIIERYDISYLDDNSVEENETDVELSTNVPDDQDEDKNESVCDGEDGEDLDDWLDDMIS